MNQRSPNVDGDYGKGAAVDLGDMLTPALVSHIVQARCDRSP
jgi:hypothetical protein